VQCAEALKVHAYFDTQLDASGAQHHEQQLEHCRECHDLLNDLKLLRADLCKAVRLERAPSELRTRILRMLDRERERTAAAPRSFRQRVPIFWAGAMSGVAAGLVAAAFAYFWVLQATGATLAGEVVKAHLQALRSGQLISVVSADHRTVKPWFAGRADVSPAIADLGANGYELLGARVEPLDGQRSAVTVYQRGAHFIDVFSWASDRGHYAESATRNGYHLRSWRVGNVQYCAVSDVGWDDLEGLVAQLREVALREDHPPS
jgi:anti-sigma factor RsiW